MKGGFVMAITLWRHRRPFEGLTRWIDDIDRWFNERYSQGQLRLKEIQNK